MTVSPTAPRSPLTFICVFTVGDVSHTSLVGKSPLLLKSGRSIEAHIVDLPRIGFGDRLSRLRLHLGMDQREFAAAIGLTHATLGRYGLVPHEPNTATLIANSVELRFGVPAEWLLGRKPTD